MSNWVNDTLDDVQDRLGRPDALEKPRVLRAMQRIYEELNRAYLLVEKSLVIAAGSFSESVQYVALPAGWLAPFRLEDANGIVTDFVYLEKQAWDGSCTGVTISEFDGKLWFSGVSASTAYTIYYFALGSTLAAVEDADLTAGQVNDVEWNRGNKSMILYKTCLELSNDYPLAAADLVKAERLEKALVGSQANRQRLKALIVGGNDVAVSEGSYAGGYREYWYG